MVEVEKVSAAAVVFVRSSQFRTLIPRSFSSRLNLFSSASLSAYAYNSISPLATYKQKQQKKLLTLIPLVAALKSLQKAMMLSPACPSAGPTGGAGLAWPAPIRRRIDAAMAFLDIVGERSFFCVAKSREREPSVALSLSLSRTKECHGRQWKQKKKKRGNRFDALHPQLFQFAGHSNVRKQNQQQWRPPRSRPTGSARRSRVSEKKERKTEAASIAAATVNRPPPGKKLDACLAHHAAAFSPAQREL